jgi:hypothetical protein
LAEFALEGKIELDAEAASLPFHLLYRWNRMRGILGVLHYHRAKRIYDRDPNFVAVDPPVHAGPGEMAFSEDLRVVIV